MKNTAMSNAFKKAGIKKEASKSILAPYKEVPYNVGKDYINIPLKAENKENLTLGEMLRPAHLRPFTLMGVKFSCVENLSLLINVNSQKTHKLATSHPAAVRKALARKPRHHVPNYWAILAYGIVTSIAADERLTALLYDSKGSFTSLIETEVEGPFGRKIRKPNPYMHPRYLGVLEEFRTRLIDEGGVITDGLVRMFVEDCMDEPDKELFEETTLFGLITTDDEQIEDKDITDDEEEPTLSSAV